MSSRDAPLPRHDRGDGADAVVTRSEEELFITTHRRETRRARLTRYTVTETVTRTVEVHHELARIEYSPVSAPDDAAPSPTDRIELGDGWMVLYDEEVVLTTRRVPRERVRLRTHSVTEDREISEALLTEQIEVAVPDPLR